MEDDEGSGVGEREEGMLYSHCGFADEELREDQCQGGVYST